MGWYRTSDRRRLAGLLLLAFIVAACAAPSGSATLPPLAGNGRTMPLPSDTPAQVRSLPSLFSCGAATFDEDERAGAAGSESPEASEASGEDEGADRGATCLIEAIERHQSAEYTVASGDQDSGGRLTIYRAGADGSVTLYVRLAPSFATPASWTTLVCRSVSLGDEGIVEEGCTTPVPIG